MEDYAQAKLKETGEMALLNLSKDIEKLDIYELVADPDLNRSLKYYVCFSLLKDIYCHLCASLLHSNFSCVENLELIFPPVSFTFVYKIIY